MHLRRCPNDGVRKTNSPCLADFNRAICYGTVNCNNVE
ncbi:hypothetical protein PATSB16_34160 [Pandoraea thiooxydans]|nr:hypothetical protein PATSB16_34160 [Pandoraea thiooxydans]